MPIASMKLTRDEPVHFRVRGYDLHPLGPPFTEPGHLMLEIDYLNYPAAPNWTIRPSELEPYQEAVDAAIQSQQVYWVDWSEIPLAVFQLEQRATLVDRLLRAVAAGQTVPAE